VAEIERFLPELLYDAENALLIDGALGRGEVG
jgi:hypothetical protein